MLIKNYNKITFDTTSQDSQLTESQKIFE